MIPTDSLRFRFAAAFVLTLFLVGSVMSLYVQISVKRTLLQDIQRQGGTVALSLARLAVAPALTENFLSLQLLLNEIRENEEDVQYAFVLNSHGTVIGHTFADGVPEALLQVNPLKSGETKRVQLLKTEKGRIYDCAASILGGELGVVHVGINAERVLSGIDRISWQITGILGLLLLVASGVAVYLARSLTRPIDKLVAAANEFGQGNLTYRITGRFSSETELLAKAFNLMAENLQSTTVSRDEVEQMNQKLEVVVHERTVELQVANARLKEEIQGHLRAEEAVRTLNLQLEERVAERTKQLETSNRELEAFCYSVSHDLIAPLRHINAFSAMLEEESRDCLGEQGEHYLERIKAGSRKMALLIDDLLKLSRVGRQQVELQQLNLGAIAGTIIGELQESEPERKVRVSVDDGLTAQGDEMLITLMLQNLLENAWKYTSREDPAEIRFGSEERNGEKLFFVRDNGIGFDMKHSGKLFGVFQRLVAEGEYSGTGVGLATVQRIIDRHGGRVWAEAEPERGATFYFTL